MTPRAYALLSLLAVLLCTALAAAKPGCTFETRPDGTTVVRCPK